MNNFPSERKISPPIEIKFDTPVGLYRVLYERLIRHIHRYDLADILHATPRQVRWAESHGRFFDSRIQQRFEKFLLEFPVINIDFYRRFKEIKNFLNLTVDQIEFLSGSTHRIISDMHRGKLGLWSGRKAMDVMIALENEILSRSEPQAK